MTLREVCEKVGGEIIVDVEDAKAESVYVGDLLSDVMGHAGEDCALVTIQNHLNTIAVSIVCHIAHIIIVNIKQNRTYAIVQA